MLEIIYRIYRVKTEEEIKQEEENIKNIDFMFECSVDKSEEVTMDCYCCETRDLFKEHIRDVYGKDIKFASSRKYPPNTIYCIIIGEHCWNTERYFNTYEYECAFCHTKVKSFLNNSTKLDHYDIKEKLGNQTNKYMDKLFCCRYCKDKYIEMEQSKMNDEDIYLESWVSRDDFLNSNLAGYIYKITKKSTGEFYVGQTKYAPIFRWGQHLKTERFKIGDILDYKFETIEKVPIHKNILEREKYWIQKCYKENPKLSLNIMQTANLDQVSFQDLKLEKE